MGKTILVLFVGFSLAVCQTTSVRPRAEGVVRRVLSQSSGVMYTSWDEKGLSRLGDAAAVEVTKEIDGRVLSKQEVRQVLFILQASFEAPSLIRVDADRSPQEASLLLKRIQRMPAASGLDEDFAGTRAVLKRARATQAR